MASTNQHAVVVGASIAGVLAAQVLAGHFERVTLVDRDEMPREPGPRGGVPQGRHVHGLLSRGREVVEEMFPGTTADLVARGRDPGRRAGRRPVLLRPAAARARPRPGLPTLAVSRPLLEWYLRHRLLHDTRVSVLEHTSVLDLAFSADDARVDGRRRDRPRRGLAAAAGRRPGRRHLRTDVADARVARASRVRRAGRGRASDRQAVRHPDVPAYVGPRPAGRADRRGPARLPARRRSCSPARATSGWCPCRGGTASSRPWSSTSTAPGPGRLATPELADAHRRAGAARRGRALPVPRQPPPPLRADDPVPPRPGRHGRRAVRVRPGLRPGDDGRGASRPRRSAVPGRGRRRPRPPFPPAGRDGHRHALDDRCRRADRRLGSRAAAGGRYLVPVGPGRPQTTRSSPAAFLRVNHLVDRPQDLMRPALARRVLRHTLPRSRRWVAVRPGTHPTGGRAPGRARV